MSHNKGKKYYLCKECNRKRYILVEYLAHYMVKFTCSQGHTWKNKQGLASQIIMSEIERMIPKIKDIFERDDLFFRSLRRRR